jgi:hypothetical protein
MDATRKLYILLELDSIGYTLLPQIKKCIDDGAILDKESYNYQLPPLWYAIYTHCSPEVVKMLYDAHYDPTNRVTIMCSIPMGDGENDADYEDRPMTLKMFIKYNMQLNNGINRSISNLKKYLHIIDGRMK